MFYNTQQSVWNRMAAVDLAANKKDTLVIAEDRDAAIAIAQDIRDEIIAYDHISTGRMIDSISVTPAGGGEFAVKGIYYTKFVNDYDRFNSGEGFLDAAVSNAELDGYSGDLIV